jgi:hypothetical protein
MKMKKKKKKKKRIGNPTFTPTSIRIIVPIALHSTPKKKQLFLTPSPL